MAEIRGWTYAEEKLGTRAPSAGRWPVSRVAAVEALWGEGYAMPGGRAETLRLVEPLALSSGMTVLLLGAGLGGPAQTICATYGAWVASFEADAEQRAIAASRALPCCGGRPHITVAGWDRAAPAFGVDGADHAFLIEALRGTRPSTLLETLAGTLPAGSQIVLTELTSDNQPSLQDREFAAWCRLDNRLPAIPRAHDVTGALQDAGYDVAVTEDMSDRHITQTLSGWREAVRAMAVGPRPATHTAAAFVTEAELWLLRIRLMRRLGVRLMRWHAIRPA